MKRLSAAFAVLASIALACGAAAPEVSESAVQTAQTNILLTATAETRALTQTARPPTATRTLIPTFTPRPPTNTPAPTATFAPIVYTGSGDAIVDVDKPAGPVVVHITGNAGSRHFAVTSYGAGNKYYDLLVNTTDPYEGYRALDFRTSEHTKVLEVKASGEWRIEILDLGTLPIVEAGTSYTSSGDGLFWVRDAGERATIEGNAHGAYFGVWAYSRNDRKLLVNTTDPYNGVVLLLVDTFLFEVVSSGAWTITVSP